MDEFAGVSHGGPKIKFKILRPGCEPRRATERAAGFDLFTFERVALRGFGVERVPLGVAAQIPKGYVGLLRGRSGLATRGIFCAEGTIDSDYLGEICALIYTNGFDRALFTGDRVAQLVIVPCLTESVIVEELSQTARGEGGFGSTGR